MDALYRNYRIAIRQNGHWVARITHVRGTLLPLTATSTLREGEKVCDARARELIDRYIAFLAQNEIDGDPN